MKLSALLWCFCLLILPCIQAAYFQPCYHNVDYSVTIQRVTVFYEPSDREQAVTIRYKAYSDVRIPKNRVTVDTFLTSENTYEEYTNESHPFWKDTECPIERGDRFDAKFQRKLPRDNYGTMSLLMRLVDKVTGRELTCIVIDFDIYRDRAVLEAI